VGTAVELPQVAGSVRAVGGCLDDDRRTIDDMLGVLDGLSAQVNDLERRMGAVDGS
jgi:hypothetical protein